MLFAFIESVSGPECLVLLGVVLIVIGPKNLPSAARKMGQVMSTLRRAADEFKRQLLTMDQEVRKAVDDVKSDYVDKPADGTDAAPPASDPADAYGTENPYENNPYPGHEEFYDETQYADGTADSSSSEVTAAASTESASASEAASDDAHAARPRRTEAELREVTFTVSAAPEKSEKKGKRS